MTSNIWWYLVPTNYSKTNRTLRRVCPEIWEYLNQISKVKVFNFLKILATSPMWVPLEIIHFVFLLPGAYVYDAIIAATDWTVDLMNKKVPTEEVDASLMVLTPDEIYQRIQNAKGL